MSPDSGMTQSALRQHVDVFVNSFIVNGAANSIRKTTRDAPWLNVGVMEKTNPEALYSSKLFSGMNVIGGAGYSLGHGFIHGYLNNSAKAQIGQAVANLNSLGADEIILYHDESVRGLDVARSMGLDLRFKPVSLLEWLVRTVREDAGQIKKLDADAAVQLPCSWQEGDGKNRLIEKLFSLIGVKRVERKFDFNSRICCGIRGYFGLATGNTLSDSDRAEETVRRNVEDARKAGAKYLVTTCPYCFMALSAAARESGLIPIQIEGLVSLALHDEPLPDGLTFL